MTNGDLLMEISQWNVLEEFITFSRISPMLVSLCDNCAYSQCLRLKLLFFLLKCFECLCLTYSICGFKVI